MSFGKAFNLPELLLFSSVKHECDPQLFTFCRGVLPPSFLGVVFADKKMCVLCIACTCWSTSKAAVAKAPNTNRCVLFDRFTFTRHLLHQLWFRQLFQQLLHVSARLAASKFSGKQKSLARFPVVFQCYKRFTYQFCSRFPIHDFINLYPFDMHFSAL